MLYHLVDEWDSLAALALRYTRGSKQQLARFVAYKPDDFQAYKLYLSGVDVVLV